MAMLWHVKINRAKTYKRTYPSRTTVRIRRYFNAKVSRNFLTPTNHDILNAVLALRFFGGANQYTDMNSVDVIKLPHSNDEITPRKQAFVFRDTTAFVGGWMTFKFDESVTTRAGRRDKRRRTRSELFSWTPPRYSTLTMKSLQESERSNFRELSDVQVRGVGDDESGASGWATMGVIRIDSVGTQLRRSFSRGADNQY